MTFTQATSFMRATTSNSSNFSMLSDRALTVRNPGRLQCELFVSVIQLSAFTPDVLCDYRPNVEHTTFNTWHGRVIPAFFLVPLLMVFALVALLTTHKARNSMLIFG